jgi:uncharacterized protein
VSHFSQRLVAAAAVALLLQGCSFLEPLPDPSRFYVLTSAEAGAPDGRPLPDLSIGLGPLRLPDYLHRQEIIRRAGLNEVQPWGANRWAGTLDSNASRVLAQNLSADLGTDRVWMYPSFEISHTDYLIDVTVVRFDLDTQNTAFLNARWEVRSNKDKTRTISRETRATHAAASADAGAGVDALSQSLGDLSKDIAAAVRELIGRQ